MLSYSQEFTRRLQIFNKQSKRSTHPHACESQDWNAYIQHIAVCMGLSHWRINFKAGIAPEGKKSIAEVQAIPFRYIAHIYLDDEFYTDLEEEQRITIVHELVHLHCHLYYELVTTSVSVDTKMKIDVGEEYMVDAISTHWARTLPLPSEFFSTIP